ncbi:TniB family NTP-binding protein [Deinococcus sp. NW-56]|uniref:TniB family NTP-binding protein n=1 Tax=Deinococcus sp. NW-56 TaxID=2080419 RepID=UPI000CF510F5|nr:TniB family NTP-binding protein [Deinococcus sp. NW-56]
MSDHPDQHGLPKGDNSIQTREDWEAYCAHKIPPRPELLTHEAYAGLSEEAREDYDLARDAWHSDFGVGSTPAMTLALERFRLVARLNANSNDPVKAHLALTGPPTQGKTTIIRHLGRDFERRLRQRQKKQGIALSRNARICPVVHYSLDSESTTRSLNTGILHYLGVMLSDTRAYNNAQLSQATAQALKRYQVQLLILDDVHLLKDNAAAIRNYLKALTSKAPIMLLLAGIDLDKTDLFEETKDKTGVKAGQTGGRTGLIKVTRFTKGGKAWRSLIGWIEDQLVLMDHQPGSLVRLQSYLWNRSQGSIGSLMTLLRLGALSVTGAARECIDKRVLDGIKIDHNAEKHGNREEE